MTGWREGGELRKGNNAQAAEGENRRKGRVAGRRSAALLTQLKSCELVVNGVLIQRR